jgi:hypothetical protein
MPGRRGFGPSASIEAQCFRSTRDSLLRAARPVGRSATALNQLVSRMALKSLLPEIQYRVSVHGTLAPRALPSFHTQKRTRLAESWSRRFACEQLYRRQRSTVFSYTALPFSGSRLHRLVMHGATVVRYTEGGRTTVGSYTEQVCKWSKILIFFRPNCTKLSSTNHNNTHDEVFWVRGEVQ